MSEIKGYQDRAKSYPEHKSSGDAWLGQVPAGWEVRRADFITSSNREQISDAAMAGIEIFHYSIPNVQEFGTARVEDGNDIDSAKTLIRKRQLLVSKLNPRKATICIAEPHETLLTVCSGEFVPIIPEGELTLRYCYYTWVSDKVVDLLSSQVQSVTRSHQRVSPEDITKLLWAWPSVEEQQQITSFLDWKTGQIDTLIARKQKLLEKLKEKRLAVITQAVTKGLNRDSPMRDSGIPWIGEVPQHWHVMKMNWICSSIRDGTHNPPPRANGVHRLLSVRNVQGGKFVLLADDRTMLAEDFEELQRSYTIEEGDIVLAIVGATTGKSAVVGKLENVTVQRSLAILRPDGSAILSSFLNYVIQSPAVQTEIELTIFKYSAQPGIYLDDVSRLRVIQPPLPEQGEIVKWLDKRIAKIDALTEYVTSAIERFIEYRTVLITAATTGKMDVRKIKVPRAE
jgi:type I restriction enzyme S subunit